MKISLAKQNKVIWILKDTVSHYSSNPRSIDKNGSCQFMSPSGAKCGVGRYISEEYMNEIIRSNLNGSSVDGLVMHFGPLDEILVDKVSGLNDEFWSKIQNLHDRTAYWEKNGLTVSGKKFCKDIGKLFAPTLRLTLPKTRTNK